MPLRVATILIAILLATLPTPVLAAELGVAGEVGVVQEAAPVEKPAEAIPTLQQVTVVGQAEDLLTGSSIITRTQLDSLPQKNGNINETLGLLPGVQLGDYYRTSDNAGEILSPNLSISGGRTYENNFTIDGISNNSLLDPANNNIDNTDNVPGHPQEIFLHPSLVEAATIYRSNIPARFGSFTGGVVNIETRDPSYRFSGEMSLRHTRSEWTSIHKDEERAAEYDYPKANTVQPDFRKYEGAILLDFPINENTGLIASYTKLYSEIPLFLIDHTEDQYRTNENFFLKMVSYLPQGTKWTASAVYSPYEAEYFRDEVVDSRYSLSNDAIGLATSIEHQLDGLSIDLNLGYHHSANKREAPNGYYAWQVTDAKPWGAIADAGQSNQYSREGGFGNVEKKQSTLSAQLHLSVDPIKSGPLKNAPGFGVSIEDTKASFKRDEELTRYTSAIKNDLVNCKEDATDCITGQQYMWYKAVHPRDKADTRIRFLDVYLEDQISYGRFSFRPGLRISTDDLQNNTNAAPRLAAGLDLFGDGTTLLIAGANRYYGKTLLTHALNEEKENVRYETRDRKTLGQDNYPKDWVPLKSSTIAATRLSDLETPYADEITAGIKQNLYSGTLNLDYIARKNKDQLAKTVLDKDLETGYQYTEWTNDGRSRHQEVSLSWDRTWRYQTLSFSVTWQETETFTSDYDERGDLPDKDDDGAADPVWFEGSLFDRDNLPRQDFNRSYIGNLIYSRSLPYGFTFTNTTRYRSGYDALIDTREDITLPSGLKYDIYEEVKRPESWVFDWRINWERATFRKQRCLVTLEINNVFNEKVLAGASQDTYELGRQIWLGMTYNF